jgi:4-methyl-5(b-hydroxyethyl)-thiazole monophosphate biosynthesis
VDARVVQDGLVVTSRGPGTAMEFALVLVERLFGREKADAVAGPMVMPKEVVRDAVL